MEPIFSGEISQQDEKLVLDSAEVLFADLPFIAKYIYKADKLKWAHSTWAGIVFVFDYVFVCICFFTGKYDTLRENFLQGNYFKLVKCNNGYFLKDQF